MKTTKTFYEDEIEEMAVNAIDGFGCNLSDAFPVDDNCIKYGYQCTMCPMYYIEREAMRIYKR
jgi:hypothetical protein|tara:strand:+ start:850 stop:1038 length:189 start_codon:yes stop_codon:yes gene_type:complete